MSVAIDRTSALVLVDMQNDFCPSGALAVTNGDQVVYALNHYIGRFFIKGAHIFATRDWHPMHHASFQERGGPWPPHCVQGTKGADFHKDLRLPFGIEVISKGFLNEKDAYSGFEGTDLKSRLLRKNVKRIFVGGLATDYCVKHTVLDALKFGFETYLLTDAVKGIDVRAGDSANAIAEMAQAGAKQITLHDLH